MSNQDCGDGETLQERQENELKALQAIFMEDFQDLRDEDAWKVQRPPEVVLILTPQESMSGKRDVNAKIHLHVKCSSSYPNEIPDLTLENAKGLSNKNVEELKKELVMLAEKLKGEVMIHELALHVQKYLHTHNQPRFESFYDEMMSNHKKQEEIRVQEQLRLEELKKQQEEKQRKAIETEILKKQEAMKEEARQERESRQLTRSSFSEEVFETYAIRKEQRSQSIDTVISAKLLTSTVKQRCHNTQRLSTKSCDHNNTAVITFKLKEEKNIHRGKCLGHSSRGNVTFIGMDSSSGELVIVEEWIIRNKQFGKKNEETGTEEENILKQIYSIEQELSSLLRLHHTNLVHYIAMQHNIEKDRIIIQVLQEHTLGQTLRHHFVDDKAVEISQLRHYASGIVNALDYLHKNSVVHKDLRDSCVFYENGRNIRLSDYSIGKRLSDFVNQLNKNTVNDVFPPSAGRGAKKGDIYRLGILLLSLLNGKYETEMYPEVPSSIPEEVQDLINKCLTKNEQTRWSAQQLLDHPFLKTPMYTIPRLTKSSVSDLAKEKDEADIENIPLIHLPDNGRSRLQNEFQILKWLGKGAFGDVLKAKNQLDGRIYAIKRIVLKHQNKQLNKKITREVKLLSKLNHENIVRYYYSWIETIATDTLDSSSSTLSASSGKATESSKLGKKDLSLDDLNAHVTAPPSADHSVEWSSLSYEVSNQSEDSSSDDDDDEDEEDFFGSSYFLHSMDSSSGDVIFENSLDKSQVIESESNVKSNDKMKLCDTTVVENSGLSKVMYIQMEFCEKSTLRTAIDQGLYADENRTWRLFREIVEGLAHIHQQGIIHRDLKPVNIFLDSDDHVKIGDFGLATTDIIILRSLMETTQSFVDAKSSSEAKDMSRSEVIDDGTLTGRVGTALYVAPELNVTSGKCYATQKVDIYSLGIIFLEMCHHPLRTTMERVSILNNVRLPEIDLPAELDEDSKLRQVHVLRWLLNHDPARRPTSHELLQSEYLPPPQMEEAELHEMLRHTISNPQSKLYKHMISTLLKQQMSEAGQYVYDMDVHKGTFNTEANLTHKYVHEILTKVFQKHGATNVITPLLVPVFSDYAQGDQCVNVMDHSGGVVALPYELRGSFARFAVRNNVINMKRYCVSRVYREKKVFGCHPKELFECAFDIVTQTPSLIADAEVLTVVGDVISEFTVLQNRSYIFHINHAAMIKAILFHCGIPEEKHNDVIASVSDIKTDFSEKFHNTDKLIHLDLSDQTISQLFSLLKMEGSLKKITDLMKPLLKQHRQISSLVKQGLHELEMIISNAQLLGLKSEVIIRLGLVSMYQQCSGLIFNVVCELKRKHRKPAFDILAGGGRYDRLLNSMRVSTAACLTKEPCQSVTGVSIALEKIISAVLEDETFKPPSAFDVLVCSIGHKPMVKEMSHVIRDLWTGGIKASLLYEPTQSLIEIQDFCREHGITYIVSLKEADSGSVRVRALERERFSEKKMNVSELVEYFHKTFSNKQEAGEYANFTLTRSDSNKSCSGSEPTSSTANNFSINFVTSEKLAQNTKRRYEALIIAHVSAVLQYLSSKVCVEVVAVEFEAQTLRNISSHIQLEGTEVDFEQSLRNIIEKNLRHKKYLTKIFDELHDLRFQRKCPMLMLYGLKDNSYKLLL